MSFNPGVWRDCYMDTPVSPPSDNAKRSRLEPGTCVKTAARSLQDAWYGRVSKKDQRGCIVVGHGWSLSRDETFVWTGTPEEFQRTWFID